MKKGKYIDYNILLACLSHKKAEQYQEANIHQQLAETVAERRQLFEKYKALPDDQQPDIHQQLRATIQEYSLKMQDITKRQLKKHSPQAA
jgi:hypothetical protein